MSTVSEIKIYPRAAEGFTELVADITNFYNWAEVKTISDTEVQFSDEGGNYIKVADVNGQKQITVYNGDNVTAQISSSYNLFDCVRYIKTSRCSVLTVSSSNEQPHATSAINYVLTKCDDNNVIIALHQNTATLFDDTSDSGLIKKSTYNTETSTHVAIGVPITGAYSFNICYNVLALLNNPLPTSISGNVTLGSKHYYMIGNFLLADY